MRNSAPRAGATAVASAAGVLVQRWESSSGTRAGGTAPLPHSVECGESVTVRLALWPPKEPGRYRAVFDLAAEGVEVFSRRGVTPLVVEVGLGLTRFG